MTDAAPGTPRIIRSHRLFCIGPAQLVRGFAYYSESKFKRVRVSRDEIVALSKTVPKDKIDAKGRFFIGLRRPHVTTTSSRGLVVEFEASDDSSLAAFEVVNPPPQPEFTCERLWPAEEESPLATPSTGTHSGSASTSAGTACASSH